MDLLVECAKAIRVPQPSDRIYKDECLYSYDTADSENGLYTSLEKFVSVGRDRLEFYYQKTGEKIFLYTKRTELQKMNQKRDDENFSEFGGDGPEKKITRLAIGIEGGFFSKRSDKDDREKCSPEQNDDDTKKHEVIFEIVVVPEFVRVPWPNNDPKLPEILKMCVETLIAAPSGDVLSQSDAFVEWDGEKRPTTKFSKDLPIVSDGVKKIRPLATDWQCERCEKKDNLWLNLSDGSILCGRKFFDGSGGNNHALEHYERTRFPLAVKLGTITKDGKADVFSYPEDEMVVDEMLNEHLMNWGINILNMEKTEKSMTELEIELNRKTNEWSKLQELATSSSLTPIWGPGYTGMTNLGNSCYLNSVMQMLFSVPEFVAKYVDGAEQIFEAVDVHNAIDDFNVQMSKLGVGLLSGKYSTGPEQTGIRSVSFKNLIGRGHPDFSTKRQQDAQEFLLHVIDRIERDDFFSRCKGARQCNTSTASNPTDCFKFKVEERIECSETRMVKYAQRNEFVLSLNVPMEKATTVTDGVDDGDDDKKRPKVSFNSCLENFAQTENIEQFFSTALNRKTTAKKTSRFASFPDRLLIQLKKFTLRDDWTPMKLDVSIAMPETLDLSEFRSCGRLANETLLPEMSESEKARNYPTFDEHVLTELHESMGFPIEACKRALFYTRNQGLEAASGWIVEHMTDSDFHDVFVPPGFETVKKDEAATTVVDREKMATMASMGFDDARLVERALRETGNDVERAIDWMFARRSGEEEEDDKMEACPSSGSCMATTSAERDDVRDGEGRYKLVGFVSHMGTSSLVGHYVVHLLKNDRWTIFNDEKVFLSENPPKDLGYLYLYERL